MIIFSIQRLIFFIVYYERLQEVNWLDKAWIFIKGLRLDLSICGYFLLIPLLLLIVQLFANKKSKSLDKIISIYTFVLLVIVLLFGIIDLSIYREWGSKLNSRAVEFLILSPGEAFASSTSSPIWSSAILLLIQLVLFIWAYRKWFKFEYDAKLHILWRIILIPVFSFIAILMMRGGLQLAPINQSAAYFSKISIVNHASLNTEWNLMHSVIENHFSNQNPYVFMDDAQAQHLVDSLYHTQQTDSTKILNTTQPNIVFVILESYTSDVVEYFGGEAAVSPNLSRYAKEGIAFSNIYASGDRTDKGMIAILSGFPTQAVRTIIQQPDKFEKLPSIPKTLGNKGYSTSFFYGGESEFANFKSYLVSAGIEKIIDKRDFAENEMNSKWGAHDEFLFDKALREIPKQKEPFISVLLTLSNHEPFEIPRATKFNGTDLPSKFRKAANYTDACIAEFMEKAKKEKWYANTLFVFIADHGHRLPKEYENAYDYRKFRIPLILYGEVIKPEFRSMDVKQIGSQTDLAATLFHQLNIKTDEYAWSKNLFDKKANSFAFYSYDNGIGWIEPNQKISVDNITQAISSRDKADKEEALRAMRAKAYMQKVFSTYLNY